MQRATQTGKPAGGDVSQLLRADRTRLVRTSLLVIGCMNGKKDVAPLFGKSTTDRSANPPRPTSTGNHYDPSLKIWKLQIAFGV